VYVNYADTDQDPLVCHGEEENSKLKEIARKYDPEEVL